MIASARCGHPRLWKPRPCSNNGLPACTRAAAPTSLGGMLQGVEQILAHRKPEAVNRVLLLTDAPVNQGKTKGMDKTKGSGIIS